MTGVLQRIARTVLRELRLTLRNPRRLGRLADPRKALDYARAQLAIARAGNRWAEDAGGFSERQYSSYETYLAHQRSKLINVQGDWLPEYDRRFREALRERISRNGHVVPPPGQVLCLAARIGTEVKAFKDLGYFAVGVDLEPGKDNHHVVVGDFHALDFADDSVGIVFTNSLDHVFELERVLREVRRVLGPEGTFVVEAMRNEGDGGPGGHESYWWDSVDSLADRIAAGGFERVEGEPFEYPWAGLHLTFRPVPVPAPATA